MRWKSFPKVELHLHLEGAADPATIRKLAVDKSVDIGGIFDADGHYQYKDFAEFLNVYEVATQALQSPEDFHVLTQSVLENLADHNVIYAEAFLSPDFCGERDIGAWKEYMDAIASAHVDGVTLKGIITCIRHFGPDKAIQTARCAAETAGDFIVGFGMAGAETAGEQIDFKRSFDIARDAGLRMTSHAGEWRGADEVARAVNDLGVERIGHGVRAIEDANVVSMLADKGIVLEVNPGSNVALGVYPDMASHPIARLRDAGVKVTVSTDDPPFFHTDMTREFEALEHTFDWGQSDFTALNETALDAAFCDAKTKEKLWDRLRG